MEIQTSKAGNFTEIKLTGRLDTNTAPELEKELIGIINNGEEDILVNFTTLDYISSSGLRVFLVAAKMLEAKGKKLNFCALKDYILEVFEIAGFSVLFNIFNSREEALS